MWLNTGRLQNPLEGGNNDYCEIHCRRVSGSWLVDDHSLDLRHNDCGGLNTRCAASRIPATDDAEAFLMPQDVSTRNDEPQLDEEVWQAWVRKNEAKDKVRLSRRKTLLVIVSILGIAAIALWRIAS